MTETKRAVLHPGKVTRIESFEELLAVDGVVEELEIRSTIGVCALHGGGLEQATEVVARLGVFWCRTCMVKTPPGKGKSAPGPFARAPPRCLFLVGVF